MRTWTVVRFPDGSWSYGGRINSPDYELCEKWSIDADSGAAAVKKARERRSRARRKTKGEQTNDR